MPDNERFDERYATSGARALVAAEMEALGTDYQASGYTTRAQADDMGDALALEPGNLLLDIGAGCGYPGLYLAKRHGCVVVCMDPVAEGGQVAHQRAISDAMSERVLAIQADAEVIPLASGPVDAVVHTDVLC